MANYRDPIALDSEEGQKLLQEAMKEGQGFLQPYLQSIFCKETGDLNCGVHSCALLMSASSLGQSTPLGSLQDPVTSSEELPYTEAKLLKSAVVRGVFQGGQYPAQRGVCLEEVHLILKAYGHDANVFYASDSSVGDFRTRAVRALEDINSGSGILVNYYMPSLGQPIQAGHHTPLGGYHTATDRVLLLDVCKENENCWVSSQHMYEAMDTLDTDAGSHRTRGFIVIDRFASN